MGPYHAWHSSVTWQLMLGKNLLWVAKQHGHSVEVMLRMYASWFEGATEADIDAIKQAMEGRPPRRNPNAMQSGKRPSPLKIQPPRPRLCTLQRA